MTVCHMSADLSVSVTDSELVTASKEEVPNDLEGRSCRKAAFGPERDEAEGTLPRAGIGCG